MLADIARMTSSHWRRWKREQFGLCLRVLISMLSPETVIDRDEMSLASNEQTLVQGKRSVLFFGL